MGAIVLKRAQCLSWRMERWIMCAILGAVDQQRGCCVLGDGKCEITLYTSCCNTDRGIYCYTTYDNHQITAVDMHRENRMRDNKRMKKRNKWEIG